MDDHKQVIKENTDLIQHEIPQNCIKKTRGPYKKKKIYKYESRYEKLSQSMTFYCEVCSKKYSSFNVYKVHMANWHSVAPQTLNKHFFGTKKKRKYKPRTKKCNTTVITGVENQMPLELKNDDNKISENSTNYMKHEKSYQISINSDSCVSHKSMTLDDNIVLDTSGDAETNADTSNNKDKSLNVLNDKYTISITANDNINSMDIVNNDTSTLVSADNNATSGINNYILNNNKKKYESRYDKLSQSMTFYCQVCSKKYTTFNTFKVHMANFHGVAPKTLNKYYFGTQERKKWERHFKKSNTVITEVKNQIPLELKNDDNKISENSTKNTFNFGTKERRKYKPRIKKSNTVITEVKNQIPLELTNDDNKISENSTENAFNFGTKERRKYKPRIKKSNTVITEVKNQIPLELTNDDIKISENSTENAFNFGIKERRKYKPRIKKSNTVITEVINQIPLELKNDDNKISENSTKNTFNFGTKERRKYKPRIKKSNTVITEVKNQIPLELTNDDIKISENSTENAFNFGIKERRKYKPRIKKSNTVITEVKNQIPLELTNDDNKISENSTENAFNFGTKERRKYKPRIKKSNTVIIEVKNQIPLELTNDDIKISEKSINYMKHEKSYQISINSDSCVSHKSMTLDDNIVLDTSGDAETNADTSNNKDKSLNVLNDKYTISITANDNINSMDILDNDTSTLVSAVNNATLGINNYVVVCRTCKQDFVSVSDFEKHQLYSIYENLRICKNQKNLMAYEPKEHYINANYNELFNSEIIPPSMPSKDTWTPDENHIKALNEVCIVQQPFYCDFCKEMCEQYDHYQFNQWCSFNENLKCHVCNHEFSDKKQLELHEREHVNLHFC